jgi:hypothetical protein
MSELVLTSRLADKLEECKGAERPQLFESPLDSAEEHQVQWEMMWDLHDKEFALKQENINRLGAYIRCRKEYY